MGVGVCPVFNPPVPSAHFDCDGKSVLREYHALDRIAVEKGFGPLSAFGDNRKVPGDFKGDPDELDELLGPWNEWFLPADGLQVVGGILEALTSDCAAREMVSEPEYVMGALRALSWSLRAAQAAGAMFRFELL